MSPARHLFRNGWPRRWAAGLLAACCLLSGSPAMAAGASAAVLAEVRWTTDGIVHVKASTWRGLGAGYGYVQAQDALCTLAEGFATYAGRRSYYFGAEGRPAVDSTFGRASNLDLDFFFQAFAGQAAVRAFARDQPADLRDLAAGFAEGYNRYVKVAAGQAGGPRRHACANAPWVQSIGVDDIYRRMIAASLAAGYARFVPEIVNARPAPDPALGGPAQVSSQPALASRLQASVGQVHGLGSNMLAFGAEATGQAGGVLFGNPHWYWGGPDRFYQAHLTLPGRMDVAGVSFLGAPVIMIGFNDHVAWSHTVSAARRFGLFELALDPADRTRYVVDGVSLPMQAVPLAVVVRRPDGGLEVVRRTLYRSKFGPVIDFGRQSPAFGWGARRALAIRDINEDNHRAFRNFFRWGQARSLQDFIAIQQQELGMPWVNTAAIGRGDGRVWYADQGAVPDVSDELRRTCAAPLAAAFAALDPVTPLLDGSRSACEWRHDPAAVQPGALAANRMPGLLRQDYVSNTNDSYWLSNPAQPLEGYPSNLGGERQPLSLRGREGHRIAAELLAGAPASPDQLAARAMQDVLAARSYAADAFKAQLLEKACPVGRVALDAAPKGEPSAAKAAGARDVDIQPACRILATWSNRAGAADRGVLLWDAWWRLLRQIPAAELHAVPFSAQDPLRTPRGIAAPAERLAQTLAQAVVDLEGRGVPLDSALGKYRFVRSEGEKLPLYGGAGDAGFFTVAYDDHGDYAMGPQSLANTYLQMVYFGPRGVQARTLLAHGQLETAVRNGPGAAPVRRYARKDWLRFPFHERDIARDPQLRRLVLRD